MTSGTLELKRQNVARLNRRFRFDGHLAAIITTLIFAASFAFGQSQNLVTGTITTSGSSCQPGATYTNCVIAAIPSGATAPAQSVGVTITGTFSGTLQFEISLDNGSNWSAVNATPPNSTSAVTSTTSTGFWAISAAGGSHIRVRASALASGSATASINPSQAIVPPAGGGSSSGTVTTFSVVTANGVSASVANPTTTPAATFTLGAITPTSTNGVSAATMAFNDATSSIQTQLNAKQAALGAQYFKLRCEPGLGDGLNAIAAGTYLQTTCYNDSGVTWTIAGIKCFTDNSGSSTLNAAGHTLGALLTGAITCSSAFAAGTQSANVALTSGDYIQFTFVADGTSKQTVWIVSMTQ